MPIQRTAATGSLLAATVMAATGLNLGVMGLNTKEPSPTAASSAAVPEQAVATVVTLPATPVDNQTGIAHAPTPQPLPPTTSQPVDYTEPSPNSVDDDDDDHDRDDHDDRTTTSAVPTTIEPPSTATTAPPSSPLPLPPQPSTTTTEPTTTAPPVSTEYLTYEFEGVATIIVALHNGQDLEFWSAVPQENWVFKVEDDESSKVKIKFRPANGGDEAEFEVKSEGGRLKIKREY